MPPVSVTAGLAGRSRWDFTLPKEEIMEGEKSVFTSKTVIGAVVTIAASISLMFGFDIGDTNGLVEQISAVLGGVLAIYGRITAVKRIG